MKLDMEVGGITYLVEVDLENECVSDVLGVEVFDGRDYCSIKMDNAQLSDFLKSYQDNLDDAYADYLRSIEDDYYEQKFEREREERFL